MISPLRISLILLRFSPVGFDSLRICDEGTARTLPGTCALPMGGMSCWNSGTNDRSAYSKAGCETVGQVGVVASRIHESEFSLPVIWKLEAIQWQAQLLHQGESAMFSAPRSPLRHAVSLLRKTKISFAQAPAVWN
jgi:hypothetical protein